MKNRLIKMFMIVTIGIMLVFPSNIFAQNNNDSQVLFSVEAVMASNQMNKNNSYFDLKMKPGQKQDLEVIVYNNDSQPLVAEVEANSATTNSGGLIDYTNQEATDESLKIPFASIANVSENRITVPPASSKKITIHVEMPVEAYDGVILGGIHITKINGINESEKNGITINNKHAYVIDVNLQETDTIVLPELNLKSMKPSLINYKASVNVNLQNSEAAIIKSMTIESKIYKKRVFGSF